MLSGERGIRTPGTREGTLVFETSTFGHSVTSPVESSRFQIILYDWTDSIVRSPGSVKFEQAELHNTQIVNASLRCQPSLLFCRKNFSVPAFRNHGRYCQNQLKVSKCKRFPASFLQTLCSRDMLLFIDIFCKGWFTIIFGKSTHIENDYLTANI